MKIFTWENGEGPWGASKGNNRKTGRSGNSKRGVCPEQPDIEDVVRLAHEHFKRFKRFRRGGHGGGNMPDSKIVTIVLAIALGLWCLSGFYVVEPDQQGVVLRFGKYMQTTEAGLHWHIPMPVEKVLKPRVTRENIVEVGFRDSEAMESIFGQSMRRVSKNNNVVDVMAESLMLTGDENIVDLDFTVRWKIADARDYLFNVSNVPATIKSLAESVMREVIGRHPIDAALTDNKTLIQHKSKTLLQNVLDSYKSGVAITGVELQQVNPPKQVIDAFRDVQAARADAEKAINQAKGYSNDILPRARGQVAQVMQEAEAYKASKIAEAEGSANRFTSQLKEYRKAPEVTRKRLYLETMQEVVGNSEKIVLPDGTASQILPYLPINQLRKGGR